MTAANKIIIQLNHYYQVKSKKTPFGSLAMTYPSFILSSSISSFCQQVAVNDHQIYSSTTMNELSQPVILWPPALCYCVMSVDRLTGWYLGESLSLAELSLCWQKMRRKDRIMPLQSSQKHREWFIHTLETLFQQYSRITLQTEGH